MSAISALSHPRRTLPPRVRRITDQIAGPVLIVVSVLIVMRGFAFGGMLTNQHADILSFILPRYCYLGERLAAGQIPLWNPWLQAGTPFAADPQSGWMYLPPMVLFSTLSCATAMRMFILFQPLLGGLSLYWFLRRERLRRTACTVGGLSFAMAMAGSAVAISMPFAAVLAWTPLVLVGAEGYFGAQRWSRRLAWMALAALAWGQVAGAHMSHGLFMCSLITATYAGSKSWHHWRHRHCSGWVALGRMAMFLGFLPVANIAFLLPRLALVPRSALHAGYAALGPTTSASLGAGATPLADGGVWSGWFFALGAAPGAYVGACTLLCIPAAWRSGRRRLLIGVLVAIAVIYLMTLNLFVGAHWFRELMLRIPYGDIYLHNPSRFRHLFLLLFPIVGALGVQGLMVDRPGKQRTLRTIGLGAGLFILVPLLLGAYWIRLGWVMIAAAALAWPLVALGQGRRWARTVVPLVVAAEMLIAGVVGNYASPGGLYLGLEQRAPWLDSELVLAPGPLRQPEIDPSALFSPGAIARAMQDATRDPSTRPRYLPWSPPTAYFIKGYLFEQEPRDWPALFNGRGMLFKVPEALGYNPFQLDRYWHYIRAANAVPIYYNASLLQQPTLSAARLLGVRYLTIPTGVTPPISAREVAREGDFTLYEVNGAEPRASVVPTWRVVSGATPEKIQAAAIGAVTEIGFDPGREAVLETDPGLVRVDGARPGTATYAETTPEQIQVGVEATAPSMVVVRNAYDVNWHATVDGKPTPILPTDGFLQGIPVPAGSHDVRLSYTEPAVFTGLKGAAIVWMAWLIALLTTIGVGTRRRRRATQTPMPTQPPAAAVPPR